METATNNSFNPSSILGALGGGSGVDMVELARNLSVNRFAAQRAQLESRNELLETRVSSAAALRGQLSQLASALGDRIRTGDLAPSATIADPSVASVALAPGAEASGSYTLEVTSLASAQTLASKSYSSADDLVGDGTFTLRFGTVSGGNFAEDAGQSALAITVDASDTVATLAVKINAAGSAVTAYVATNSSGAQLVLKGAEGAANGFVVEAESNALLPSNQPGNLSYLGWEPSSDSGQLTRAASNATFLLDGVEFTGTSNSVDGLPGGLSLDLAATNIGAPTRITFSDNSDRIEAVMNDLVAALNDITGTLRDAATPLGGELGSDPGARALKRAFASLTQQVVMPSAAAGEPDTLADLGLTIGRDGSFTLDSDRLAETLGDNSEAAAAMFTNGVFGVFATIDDLARSMASPSDPGSLAGSEARYTALIERNGERLEKYDEQQERLRERLTKTFTASDRNVISSQSTLEFLRAQIAVWNGDNN